MAAAAASIDLNALSAAICRGVVDGNKDTIAALASDGTKRHDLREVVQHNTDKVWELDGEIKLIKGFMVTLMGSGDGNGGMVNRIDKDMGTLTDDVASLKSQVSEINRKLDSALEGNKSAKSFQDGWKGVGIAVGIIATCLSIMGGIAGGLLWLFQHGGAK